MTPRFVDMNADGYSDLVVGTYDGVVLIGFGSDDGFEEAKRVFGSDGKPVAISKYYDWERTESKRSGWKYLKKGSKAHGTSACPVDWDADGDFDLLIGDSEQGGLYVRINEGTAKAPKFASENIPVTVGDRPVHIRSLVSDSLVVDWNQDGLFDIILGGLGGGVYLLENSGKADSPEFAAVTTLVEQVDMEVKPKRMVTVETHDNRPVEPGTAIQLAAVDYDHDGKLDLLAGGRSTWILDNVVGMTESDKQAVARLEDELAKMSAEVDAIYTKIANADKADKTKRAELTRQVRSRVDDQRQIDVAIRKLEEKDKPNRRGDFVWLFKGK